MLPAMVIVLQRPATEEDATRDLIDYTDTDVQLFCAVHTTEDLPDELILEADKGFESRIFTYVVCPKQGFRRHVVSCLRYMECADHCDDIRQLLGNTGVSLAREIAERCRKRRLKAKDAESWDSPTYGQKKKDPNE